MSHDMWLYDVEKNLFILELPSDFGSVEECLSGSIKLVTDLAGEYIDEEDYDQGLHLFMENKYIKYKGSDEKGIVVFASEFPIGIIVMNAEMQNTNIIGPYSTKNKKLYKAWHKRTPEA